MSLLERMSEVKETTERKVTDAKESASETAHDSLDTVADRTPAEADAVAERISDTRTAVARQFPSTDTGPERWMDLLSVESAARPATLLSYDQLPSLGSSIQTSVQQYGTIATEAVQEVDLERTFRFGRRGLRYGKVYGDYVPVAGDFMPHAGFAAGVGMGILDSADLLSIEDAIELSSSLSAAAAEFVYDDGQSFSRDVATDAAAPSESAGESDVTAADAILEMDYDEFAATE